MLGPDFLNPCPSMIEGNDLRGDIKAMLPVNNDTNLQFLKISVRIQNFIWIHRHNAMISYI